MNIEQLKYPIGKFAKPVTITDDLLAGWIADIATFPQRLNQEVHDLTDSQLDTPYRPDGWTIRQVVHHCADSHMNSLVRFKLALTEDQPTIKSYHEDRWAELVDSKTSPISSALKMIDGIHEKWTVLLNHMTSEDLKRTFIHPVHGRTIRLDDTIALYAWHSNHHLAHIVETKKRNNWN
jgi:hypothetical protein